MGSGRGCLNSWDILSLMQNPDDQEYRRNLWEKEYGERKELPSTRRSEPSRALVKFLDRYKDWGKDLAVDVGSGKGRNSFYLVEQGFARVVGIEWSEAAMQMAVEEQDRRGVHEEVQFINQSLDQKMPVKDGSVDLVIDMMTLHALSKSERENVAAEVTRVLKPGGYLVVYTVAAESPQARVLISENPGPEENSYRFMVGDDWVTEKAFRKDELLEMWQPLELVSYEEELHDTRAFGDTYARVYLVAIWRK